MKTIYTISTIIALILPNLNVNANTQETFLYHPTLNNSEIIKEKTVKKVAKTITTKEVSYLLDVKKSGLQHYYSLAIPINSIETVDLILEEIDDEQVIEISVDNKLYSIGKYTSFEKVIAARKQFIESEIFDVFIMAQITDQRIDEDDSKQLALSIQTVVNELATK
ncbi:MAG: hypothetical protein ACPGSL_10130 [Vicingaceae bacterium]